MRIGIDAFQLQNESAGIGSYLYNLISQLEKIDNKNEYFLYFFKNIKMPFENNSLWHKRCYGSYVGDKGFFWYLLMAKDQLRKDKIDIFWATQNIIFPGIPKEIKTVLTMHDLVWYFMPETVKTNARFLLKWLGKISLSRANYILCVSNSTLNDLRKVDIPVAKIKVIYNGINKEFLKNNDLIDGNDRPVQSIQKEKFFLCVSTLEPRKNYVRIIRAFVLFCQRHPELSDYKLVIVGVKGWKYQEIMKEYNSCSFPIRNRIQFLGYVDSNQLLRLYSTATLLLFPSLSEGFGFPIIEAMACGCPVITSNISSMPEVAGDAAFLVNPYDAEDICKAVFKVLSDDNFRKELKQKGFQNIKRFSWKETAKEMVDIFYKVLG